MRDLRDVSGEILWLINHRVRVPQTKADNWSAIEAQLAVLQERLLPECVQSWLEPGPIRERALDACTWLWTENGQRPPSARWRPMLRPPGVATAYCPEHFAMKRGRDHTTGQFTSGRRLDDELVTAIRAVRGTMSLRAAGRIFDVHHNTVKAIWLGSE